MAASAPPNLVVPVGPQPTQLLVSYSIAANAVNGSLIQGSVQAFGPLVGASASVQVPISEVWSLVRLSTVGGAVGPDAIVVTILNGISQVVFPTLSSLNENVLHPFALTQSIPFPPGSTFASSISTLSANGATAVTQVVKYWIVRAPYTG